MKFGLLEVVVMLVTCWGLGFVTAWEIRRGALERMHQAAEFWHGIAGAWQKEVERRAAEGEEWKWDTQGVKKALHRMSEENGETGDWRNN